MVYQVLYVSHSTNDMSQNDLDRLLSISRQNNRENQITGILMYNAGVFIQLIEGPPMKVLDLVDHIKKDRRHTNYRALIERTSKTRLYPAWDMKYVANEGVSREWMNIIVGLNLAVVKDGRKTDIGQFLNSAQLAMSSA